MTVQSTPSAETVSGFRRLRVLAKVPESRTITSFHLAPVEEDGWHEFGPGQFLVFRIPTSGADGFVLRNYSVSSDPGRSGVYRITVKRERCEQSPTGSGVGSGYLHDRVAVGDELRAEGPRGAFVLDGTSRRPLVLLSGGVGVTPLVSMLHRLAAGTERTVHFIHACDNVDLHALGDEVEEIARVLAAAKTPFNVNGAAQIAAVAALGDRAWMEASVARLRGERERLRSRLAVLGYRIAPSQTNFLFLNGGGDSAELANALLADGIIVKPWREPGHERYVRVTVGTAEDNDRLVASLTRLSRA